MSAGTQPRFPSEFERARAGVVFWSEYAPPGMSPILYSLIYNGSYMLPEIVISGIFVFALMKRGILEMNL